MNSTFPPTQNANQRSVCVLKRRRCGMSARRLFPPGKAAASDMKPAPTRGDSNSGRTAALQRPPSFRFAQKTLRVEGVQHRDLQVLTRPFPPIPHKKYRKYVSIPSAFYLSERKILTSKLLRTRKER